MPRNNDGTGRLHNKAAVITGGGQGLGRGIALAMVAEGARVALLGRTKSKCDAVLAEVEERGGSGVSIECDVEHVDAVDSAIAEAIRSLGGLDVLVNSAQATYYGSVRRLEVDQMESMWRSGPMGTFHTMRASFDALRASKGCVVNVGSGSSIRPLPAMSGYAMAKEAIRILTRVAAMEWGRYGIRVNAICPLADTPGWQAFADYSGDTDTNTLNLVPLGRIGDPELDIGRGVVYLASDDSAYVTGTTLMLDGGLMHLR